MNTTFTKSDIKAMKQDIIIRKTKGKIHRFLVACTYTLIVGLAFYNAGQTEMFYLTNSF